MKPPFISFNHISLHVQDLTKSTHFYADIIGLRKIKRPDFDFEGAWFGLGNDQQLHLIVGRKEPVYNESRGTHFALSVQSVLRFQEKLEELGIEHRPIKYRPDGLAQLFLRDPDGYLIELNDAGTSE